MNQVNLIGNLTRNPEMRTTGNGTAVTTFNIAVNSGYGDNQQTAFVPIKTWKKVAENCNKYLEKGRKVAITGTLSTGSYEKDGRTIYTWEVVANQVEFLNSSEKSNGSNETQDISDDDVPFSVT